MSVQVEGARYLAEVPVIMIVEPVTLQGQYVRMEPLSLDHHAGLCKALLDEELWRWLAQPVHSPDEMQKFIIQALKWRDDGISLPFTTILQSTGEVVGMSRYLSIERAHHTIEIGGSVIGKNWQRTAVNTEAKFLMLKHAFETLGCIRVQFQTDSLNTKSQNAIARLGATRDGVFRNHKICWDGRIRHSVYFSITDEEWPKVKANLEGKLARPII